MSSEQLAKELLDKFSKSQVVQLKPMIVAGDTPLTVNLDKDTTTTVQAISLTGELLTVGATGFAFWAPPLPPIVFATSDDDTGWVDVTYASGFTDANGGQLAYRKIGKQVYLRGGANRTAGDYSTTAVTVATLPTIAHPGQTERYASYGTLGRVGRVEITSAGAINVAVPNNVDPDSPFGWMGLSHTYLTD
jgi:hypothetical protein